jgi:5-carboxymethyl-2-hydroxymuconate isomerase
VPHCVIEYTRNIEAEINISDLLGVAFEGVASCGHFNREAIKARAIPFDIYKSGLDRDDYIHIKLRILSGRTPEQKKQISDHMIEQLIAHVGRTKSLTVEIIDMDIGSYGKYIAED